MPKREFSEADREKKNRRMPAKGASETGAQAPAGLAEAIRTSLAGGYLPCPAAWAIAKRTNTALAAVGSAADELGVRIVDCQLGCFKVEKASHDDVKEADPRVASAVQSEVAAGPLTCSAVFALARRLKVRPLDVAGAADRMHIKVRQCQLGCF